MSEKCSEWSHDGRMTWKCPRPVKEEGMCAQHLAGKRRREKNRLKMHEQWDREKRDNAAAEAIAQQVTDAGLKAQPYYSGIERRIIPDKVIVDGRDLLRLLGRDPA